jgi:hypothetical protein
VFSPGNLHRYIGEKATIPFRFKRINTCDDHAGMSGENVQRDAELADGDASAAVAIASQMMPLRTENMSEEPPQRGSPHPTCVQSRRPRGNEPPLSRRRLSNPTSAMTSKMMSETKVTTMLAVLSLVLVTIQLSKIGFHVERSCRLISLDYRNQLRLVTYPHDT